MKSAEFKLNVLKDFELNKLSINEIIEKHNICKKTFYNWLNSFNQSGFDGLVPKSTKPKNIKSTPNWAEEIILELKNNLDFGCKNIEQTIKPLYKISHQGILNILRRNGISIQKEKKKWKRFRAPHKNHTWQIDFLGPHSTPIGNISLLVVLDDYSRYARSMIVPRNGTTQHLIIFLKELFKELGKPKRIQTDNGTQFKKVFNKWCKKQGVINFHSSVRHPQTMGKVESVNKILGRHFKLNFNTIKEGQNKLNALMKWYNHLHENSTIKSTPAQAYEKQENPLKVLEEIAKELELTKILKSVKTMFT